MMSKFYEKYQSSLHTAELKRVKVTYLNGFEGFVLEENENGALVYIVSAPRDPDYENTMMDVTPDQYEEIDGGTVETGLDLVKQYALQYMMQKGLITCQHEDLVQSLMSSPCVYSVEEILRSVGLVDSEILEIIKAGVV